MNSADLLFFFGAILVLIGGPILMGIVTYAHFFRNPNGDPFWVVLAFYALIIPGMIASFRHVRNFLKKPE